MLEAIFTDYVDHITVNGLTQWDVGQKLKITLATLKGAFQVHFANKQDDTAYVVEGTATNGVGTVDIPNIILQKPVGAKAWLYVYDGDAGETIKTIDLPITSRAKPSDYIYKEIEILNYEKIIAEAEALVKAAAKSETNAKASATAASSSAATADAAKNYVEAIVAGNEAYTKYEADTTYASVIALKATGSPILIKGSSNKPVLDFSGFGRSEQAQYTGKNLIPYPHTHTTRTAYDLTATDKKDGTISMSGTPSANFWYAVADKIKLPKGKYILSGCPSGGGSAKYYIIFRKHSDSSDRSAVDYGSGASFEITDDTVDYTILVGVIKGNSVTDLIFSPMIRQAEVTDGTFEPYVGCIPSPNPDYPQDIVSVGEGGTLEVKSEGKNLLPYPYYDGTSKTVDGVTTTIDENGWAHIKGTPSTGIDCFNFTFRDIEFQAGTYTISGVPKGASAETYRAWLGLYKAGTTISIKKSQVYDEPITFTVDEPFTMIFRATANAGATIDVIYKPMLRRAEVTDDTYELYKSSSVSIPLAEPLRSIGNVKDEIACVDGVYGVIRRIGSKVFDGSDDEKWTSHNQYVDRFYILNKDIGNLEVNSKAICSHYSWCPNVEKVDYGIQIGNNLNIKNKDITSLANWKTELKANPITTDYILANEVFEAFVDQSMFDNLVTYDNVTYITATDNAEMEVTYATDTKSYIDNKFAELQAALVNLL